MFGPLLGPLLTIPIAICLYFVLRHLSLMLNNAFDFMIYMTFALYVYMVLRSLLNISQFIYMPLSLLLLSKLQVNNEIKEK